MGKPALTNASPGADAPKVTNSEPCEEEELWVGRAKAV